VESGSYPNIAATEGHWAFALAEGGGRLGVTTAIELANRGDESGSLKGCAVDAAKRELDVSARGERTSGVDGRAAGGALNDTGGGGELVMMVKDLEGDADDKTCDTRLDAALEGDEEYGDKSARGTSR